MAGYTVTTFFTMSSLILSFLDTVIDTVILMVRGLLHSIPLALCLSTCYCTWRYGIVSVHDGVVFWTLTIWEDLAVILCYWAAWWYIVFFVTIVGLRIFVDRRSIVAALATTLNDEFDWR